MFEHPSFIHDALIVEQERIDRANELRRVIAENPSRIARREHPLRARIRGWFRTVDEDAAASPTSGAAAAVDRACPAHAQ